MARRKQKLSVYDLGRLPVVPAKKAEGYETRAEFYAREKAEAEARAMAPIRKLEAEFRAECADITRRVKAFYSLDLEEMKSYSRKDAPVDYIRPEGGDFEARTGPRDGRNEAEAYWKFRNDLNEQHGTQLTDEGWIRLGTWVGALIESGVAPSPAVWEALTRRMREQTE